MRRHFHTCHFSPIILLPILWQQQTHYNWLCTTFQILTERESASTTNMLFLYQIDQLLRTICLKISAILLYHGNIDMCVHFHGYWSIRVSTHALAARFFFQLISKEPLWLAFPEIVVQMFWTVIALYEKAIFQLFPQCPLCVNSRKIQELQHFPFLILQMGCQVSFITSVKLKRDIPLAILSI